jgi:hypothetical protein
MPEIIGGLYADVQICDICAHVVIDPDAGSVCRSCRESAAWERENGWDGDYEE